MSDKNTIYEITQLINDKTVLQNDLYEILGIVKDSIYKKYITKFQLALDEQKNIISKDIPKEINLLASLKPFTEDSSHVYIDQIIDIMYKVSAAKKIDIEIQKCSTIDKTDTNFSAAELTIHDDGIYELDNKCESTIRSNNMNVTELILLMLITGVIK